MSNRVSEHNSAMWRLILPMVPLVGIPLLNWLSPGRSNHPLFFWYLPLWVMVGIFSVMFVSSRGELRLQPVRQGRRDLDRG